jgi:NADH-quinone oxidoreductase subunit G
VAAAVAGVEADAASLAVANSLLTGRKVAVWLGNFAVQHPEAAKLQFLAQELSRLLKARLGVIGEAANSVGAYVAGATPLEGQGKNAAQMLSESLKGYLLFGFDPELDVADGAAAVKALKGAGMVAAFTAFKSETLLDVADVLLPLAPFTETAGTFVNCEGRAQSFYPVVRLAGETRPGWKILRVIGSLLGIAGFDVEKAEDVRATVLGGAGEVNATLLSNELRLESVTLAASQAGLERVWDVPIHFADPIARRSAPLLATKDAALPVARVNAETLAQLGLADGADVLVKSAAGAVKLKLVLDAGVAARGVRVSGAHASTVALGALHGKLSVERV